MSTLGLDIGTSGCKAVAFDADGRVLASAGRTYPLAHPQPGRAELDAMEVWQRAAECIREVATAAGQPVTALAVCSQGEAFVAVDEAGRPLCPAMVSSDTRAADIVSRCLRSHGAEFFYQRSGHTPHALFSLFKLLWLRENEPEVWRRARRFLCFEDFIHARLGIAPAISWSMAGRTMLFDPAAHDWQPELLQMAGIEPDRLARPLEPGAIAGEIPTAIAHDLGLASGCLVVAGGHDQVAAALGAGVAAPGGALYAMGSVECMVIASDRLRLAAGLRDANLCSYDHAAPGCRAHLAYNLTGSNLLAWFRNQFAAEAKPPAGASVYDWSFGQLPTAPSDLLVLPYFTASGTPHFDPHARGAILGLGFEHDRFDILKAMVESLAHEMRLNLGLLADQGIPVTHFRATGGGTRSLAALQTKADVLQIPIIPTLDAEGGCLGTALLARAARDGKSVRDYLPQWVRLGETIEPNPAHRAAYDEAHSRYLQLYSALQPVLRPS